MLGADGQGLAVPDVLFEQQGFLAAVPPMPPCVFLPHHPAALYGDVSIEFGSIALAQFSDVEWRSVNGRPALHVGVDLAANPSLVDVHIENGYALQPDPIRALCDGVFAASYLSNHTMSLEIDGTPELSVDFVIDEDEGAFEVGVRPRVQVPGFKLEHPTAPNWTESLLVDELLDVAADYVSVETFVPAPTSGVTDAEEARFRRQRRCIGRLWQGDASPSAAQVFDTVVECQLREAMAGLADGLEQVFASGLDDGKILCSVDLEDDEVTGGKKLVVVSDEPNRPTTCRTPMSLGTVGVAP